MSDIFIVNFGFQNIAAFGILLVTQNRMYFIILENHDFAVNHFSYASHITIRSIAMPIQFVVVLVKL